MIAYSLQQTQIITNQRNCNQIIGLCEPFKQRAKNVRTNIDYWELRSY